MPNVTTNCRFPAPARLAALAVVLGLGACAVPSQPDFGPSGLRHQIQVAESIERLEIYPSLGGFQLSARDQQAMVAFLDAYRREGSGPIYMNRPEQGTPSLDTAAREVRVALAGLGLDVPVQEGAYPSAPGAPAPLVVSYRRLKTLIPNCRTPDAQSHTFSNAPTENWGCAHTANIAALVADPNQFLEPYPLGLPDTQRRMRVYESYINGEAPNSQRPADQRISSQETGG